MENKNTLVQVQNLRKEFTVSKSLIPSKRKKVTALDGVNLSILENETLGLVGESGCGKSTFGRTLLGLIPATEGQILYRGENLAAYKAEPMRQMRKKMQMIFQDPYGSLNPRMTVEQLVQAPLDVYHIGTEEERREKVLGILERVGLGEKHLQRYPHEFSGGQRQRIGIARALILHPEFVVCDEPVSALDVSVRAQVLNLIRELQEEMNLTFLFISHDLSVVKHISDRVAVMYLGNIVELAEKDEFYQNPQHPYTRILLASIPIPDRHRKREKIAVQGEIPSASAMPEGCRFHTRCAYADEKCASEIPELRDIGGGHLVACHKCFCGE